MSIRIRNVAIIFAFACVCACSPKAEKKISVTDPQTGEKSEVTVSKDLFSENVKIENKETGATLNMSEGKMPDAMPKFISAYPSSKELKTMHAKDIENQGNNHDKGEAVMVGFNTPDSPDKVTTYYKDIMLKNGFKEEGNMSMGQIAITTFTNAEDKSAMQVIVTNETAGKSEVQLIYSKAN